MPEGLSATEAGKGLEEHIERTEEEREKRNNRTISIIEASLLAIVAVLAAYSGWAAAKYSTESSLSLAQASVARAEANLDALNSLNFDVTAFNAWFTAYVANDPSSMAIAARRFTPNFRRAFEAWLATKPATNPNAPPGPTYMPQYLQPAEAQAAALNAKATAEYNTGEKDGSTSDDYVRTTIYLATVLFLAGLGSHFAYRAIRYGLATVGSAILIVSVVLLATSPKPF